MKGSVQLATALHDDEDWVYTKLESPFYSLVLECLVIGCKHDSGKRTGGERWWRAVVIVDSIQTERWRVITFLLTSSLIHMGHKQSR